MFKQLLEKGMKGGTFSIAEAETLMDLIMEGEATDSQIASLLTLLRFREETVDEIIGFARSLREHGETLPEPFHDSVDTCGTGGDGSSTFNISTAAAIVMSSLGMKVAKHGNRGISSKSGSADVLEYLGIPVQMTAHEAATALKTKNMCFLYAPLYHKAMKHAAVPRKEIGFRTIFNLIGPLANPAGSKHQLLGVSDKIHARKIAEALRHLGAKKALIVSGADGLDECSISTRTDVIELSDGKLTDYQITPEEMGLQRGLMDEIRVSSPRESAAMIEQIFKGESTRSAIEITALNAGAGMYVSGFSSSIKEGVQTALNALSSGHVYDHFRSLQKGKGATHYA